MFIDRSTKRNREIIKQWKLHYRKLTGTDKYRNRQYHRQAMQVLRVRLTVRRQSGIMDTPDRIK